jgi:hypothetical protein
MKNDPIVEEIRRVRKEIENESGNNWAGLGKFLINKQKANKKKLFYSHPQKLVRSKVA